MSMKERAYRNNRIVLFASTIVVLNILTSCSLLKKIEYRDRDVNHYITNTVHDTLFQNTHDSVYHTVFQKGDTVFDTKYVEKTRWRDRIVVKTDTCYRDSIQKQIKETVIEKTKVPKWAYYCLGICVLFIVITFIKLIRWVQIH